MRPVIYLLNGLNWFTVYPISQWFYLKLPFFLINPYNVFTCQRLYIITIFSTITYNLILLLNLKQYIVLLPLFWCFQCERGCENLDSSIYHAFVGMIQKWNYFTLQVWDKVCLKLSSLSILGCFCNGHLDMNLIAILIHSSFLMKYFNYMVPF